MDAEIWMPVAGFEDCYEVSSHGRVRSLTRWVNGRVFQSKVLTPVDDGKGYPKVVLRVRGKASTYKVHRLVCRAFHGEPGLGLQAHHNDSNPWNSRADNLSWVTASENSLAKAGGQSGERHPRAKLTEEQANDIRRRAAGGESGRAIARSLGISYSHANRVISGARRASETTVGLAQTPPSQPSTGAGQ